MKVGILTYHRARNYGAFVQTYALQQQLKKRFPDVKFEVVDFEYKDATVKKKIDYIKHILRMRKQEYVDLFRMDSAFKREYSKLPLGKRIVTNNTKKAIDLISKEYDFIIIGSDAVFNWQAHSVPNVYFFNTDKCEHVTYAASSHLNMYREATLAQVEEVRDALSKMKYIGVRDAETKRFVSYFNPSCSSYHNCDPTVVLDMDYEAPVLDNLMKKAGIKKEDKIIVLMLKEKKFGKYVKEKFGDEYKIVSVRKNNPYADIFISGLSPLEWSKVFSYAKLTVTDFFHGSLLSLKNGTPVISIDSSKYFDYESKAKDLFETQLKLPEFFYDMAISDDSRKIFIDKCINALNTDYSKIIPEVLKKEAEYFDEFCKVLSDIWSRNDEI